MNKVYKNHCAYTIYNNLLNVQPLLTVHITTSSHIKASLVRAANHVK